MPKGPHQGEALDPRYVSSQLISDKEAASIIPFSSDKNYYVLNFKHADGNYLAEIPKSSVPETGIATVTWNKKTDHVLLKFTLPENGKIRLFPQNGPLDRPVAELSDFYFDSGSQKLASDLEPYSFKRGRRGNYALRYGIYSRDEVISSFVHKQGMALEEYPLLLSDRDRVDLFKNALKRSSRVRDAPMYHTDSENCSTEVVGLLELSVREDSWTAGIRRRLLAYYARAPWNVLPYIHIGRMLELGTKSQILPEIVNQDVVRFVGNDTHYPVSYGIEVEYEIHENPRLLEYYRPSTIDEVNWLKLSIQERIAVLDQQHESKNLLGKAKDLIDHPSLLRLSNAPRILPQQLIGEMHGTYELNGLIEDTLKDVKKKYSMLQSLLGDGYIQGHVVFPETDIRGATGYTVFESDRSQFSSLIRGYLKYLDKPESTPGQNILHYALSPMNERSRKAFLRIEGWSNEGRKIKRIRGSRLINGPALRGDVYPKGFVGFELRQYGKRFDDMIESMDDLSSELVGSSLAAYSPFSEVETVHKGLLDSTLNPTQHKSAIAVLQKAKKQMLSSFPLPFYRKDGAIERFLIPFRPWEIYPLVTRLSPHEKILAISRIQTARNQFIQTLTDLDNPQIDAKTLQRSVLIAIARWAYESHLNDLFENAALDRSTQF